MGVVGTTAFGVSPFLTLQSACQALPLHECHVTASQEMPLGGVCLWCAMAETCVLLLS